MPPGGASQQIFGFILQVGVSNFGAQLSARPNRRPVADSDENQAPTMPPGNWRTVAGGDLEPRGAQQAEPAAGGGEPDKKWVRGAQMTPGGAAGGELFL